MAASKRRREDPSTGEAADEWTLPADLLVEIVARSDARTLIRGAAVCKPLRRDILCPSVIRRVTQEDGGIIVPPCIVAYLNTYDDNFGPPPPVSLVHPAATPSTVSFTDDHLSPYMSRSADDLLSEYCPVTSRGGLVLLRRRRRHENSSDTLSTSTSLCLYDPITGHRTFLPNPPGMVQTSCFDHCILLTAAEDDIGCSLLLLLPYIGAMTDGSYTSAIEITTRSSSTSTCAAGQSTWGPAVVTGHGSINFSDLSNMARNGNPVVLRGGVIHWLEQHLRTIVSYSVRTSKYGTIKLPHRVIGFKGRLHLGSYYDSHDGHKLLRLLAVYGFKIRVWHQLRLGGDWATEPVIIDTEEKLRSLDPDIPPRPLLLRIEFEWSGEKTNSVLLHVKIFSRQFQTGCRHLHVILDLETQEMRRRDYTTSRSVLVEIDLPSRLRAMKIFP